MKIAKFKPDLNYTLGVFETALKYDLNAHKIGKIIKFNPQNLTVDVQLLEKKTFQENIFDYPPLLDMPLMIDGLGNKNLTFGDVTGADCIIHFNDTDIDDWFSTGEPYIPPTDRLHDFSDGFVSLSPRSLPNVFAYDSTGVVLNNGATKVKLTEDSIEITNGSCVFSMQGDTITITGKLIVSDLITGKTDIMAGNISSKNHTHTSAAPGNPTSPPLP